MSNGNLVYLESHYNSTRLEKDRPIFLIHSYDVLWLATSNGQKIRPIYDGTQLFGGMTLSPDGKKIVFVSNEDPLHPSSNDTDIVNFFSMGGPIRNDVSSYLTIYDMDTNKFTIMKKSDNDDFWNLKWISDDHIMYETLLHQCVQDKMAGEQSCPAGLLQMMTVSDHSSKILYGNQVEPYTSPLVGVAISPDGRSLIFGINYDYSNGDIDGKGIYRMDFAKSLLDTKG
ncbi:MAG TPA: hypothetical protein VFX64_05780 [Candidatus Nitrosotalea sp.]|nr:hypothetical protein [Candidatus Nitrosotalea sp.]